MPLTPLHLAAGMPLKKWISLKAFIIVNILIDLEPGMILLFDMDTLGYPLHQGVHSLGGVTLAGCVTVAMLFTLRVAALLPIVRGAFWGAYSHLFLDALVHSDVTPFGPFLQGNPVFLNLHAEVSLGCAIVLTYFLAKWVESLRVGEVWSGFIRELRRRFFSGRK